jgi:hypothetical protein
VFKKITSGQRIFSKQFDATIYLRNVNLAQPRRHNSQPKKGRHCVSKQRRRRLKGLWRNPALPYGAKAAFGITRQCRMRGNAIHFDRAVLEKRGALPPLSGGNDLM